MSKNTEAIKARDFVGVDDFLELAQRIQDYTDLLALRVPRVEPKTAQSAPTDAEPTSTTAVTIDFSKDSAPANAIGVYLAWNVSNANAVSGQISWDGGSNYHTLAVNGQFTPLLVFFQPGTQTIKAKYSGAPGAITTNSMNISGWIY